MEPLRTLLLGIDLCFIAQLYDGIIYKGEQFMLVSIFTAG
jgi:hypothetical protein